MSDTWWDALFGIGITAICVGLGVLMIAGGVWLLGVKELNKCAEEHNVYACEFVVQPVVKGAREKA